MERLLVVVALALSVWYFDTLSNAHLPWKSWKDSGHAFVFFLGTYFLLLIGVLADKKTGQAGLKRIPVICGASFCLGISIEIIQPYFGRQASFTDIIYDFFGILAAASLFALRHLADSPKKFLLASLAVLTALSTARPLYDGHIVSQRTQAIPTLFDFDSGYERSLWQVSGQAHASVVEAPVAWFGNSTRVAKLSLLGGNYPGIRFHEPHTDWRSFQNLSFYIYSPANDVVQFNVRIHDQAHNNDYSDRFNRSLTVLPGVNRFSIPLMEIANAPIERHLQLDAVDEIAFFSVNPPQPVTLYLDNLKLN